MHALAFAALSGACLAAADPATDTALPWGSDPPLGPALARAASISALGRQIFFDAGMSGSGEISCASCHDARAHFGPPNAHPVQPGGVRVDRRGTRAAPGLTYGAFTPFFTEHCYESEDDGNESIDQGPTGGRTWDGRVSSAREQARIPLLSPVEMAGTEAAVVARAAVAPYADEMRRLYGENIFADSKRTFAAIGEALEAFQETPQLFSPFTSKYDAFLRGQAQLTAQEKRGLAAFMDPGKGNCIRCHKNQVTAGGKLPIFTDSGYAALAVPRNMHIPANQDPKFYDLGLCGPDRHDLATRPEFCGLFKAPSLRNVATRKSFYHNGVFHSLEDAVAFYATRDTNPERWYPKAADGTVMKFNDLPADYHKNVDVEAPFGRAAGGTPALSSRDIKDIVAYLGTLTDGYQPTVRGAAVTAGNRQR